MKNLPLSDESRHTLAHSAVQSLPMPEDHRQCMPQERLELLEHLQDMRWS